MKKMTLLRAQALLCLLPATQGLSQAFTSGSSGADGALLVTNAVVLNMPANGVFNFTTISVTAAGTLSFKTNALNTPVYLLASGDVIIAGTVDVSGLPSVGPLPGAGGPGGFEGGYGGYGFGPTTQGGDGKGPGGGKYATASFRASGAFGSPGYNNPAVYGNVLLYPLVGGSGGTGNSGGPGFGSGGGGGAILIASSTHIQVDGTIRAVGGSGIQACGGSGGAIRLVAPLVSGGGSLRTTGGSGYATGGNGRIRIDSPDAYSFRSIQVFDAVMTHGAQMFVFKPITSRLDIIELLGQSIPLGTQNPVQIVLPPGVATNATITIQAHDFSADIPIAVVVTPENVASTTYNTNITFTGNPSQLQLSIAIPAGEVSHVDVWTR
jgi:hypothetical protein